MAAPSPRADPGRPEPAPGTFAALAPEAPGQLLRTWSGWGFLICAVVAVGYGLGTLYGSGSRVALLDVTAAGSAGPPPAVAAGSSPPSSAAPSPAGTGGVPGAAFGPIHLDPGMSPVRAILRASHAPMGSTRIRYEIAVLDEAGRPMCEAAGAFGSSDDEASIVHTTTSLGDFDVARPGACSIRVRMSDGSVDDLRAASLELRRNALPVDPRIPWGFGLGALACLIANLVASRRRPWPYQLERNGTRTAA